MQICKWIPSFDKVPFKDKISNGPINGVATLASANRKFAILSEPTEDKINPAFKFFDLKITI